jgi:hypothetical protein
VEEVADRVASIAAAIPDRKAELFKDMETVISFVQAHGGQDDLAWLESVRRELWMEKRA